MKFISDNRVIGDFQGAQAPPPEIETFHVDLS